MIELRCPTCRSRARLSPSVIGRKVRCSKCSDSFRARLPEPSAEPKQAKDTIRVSCPCGMRGKVPAEHAGRVIRCRKCKCKLRIPGGQEVVARRPDPEPEASLRRDPDLESHLGAIAIWNLIVGVLVLGWAALSAAAEPRLLVVPEFLGFAVGGGLSVALGVGLPGLKDWAWYVAILGYGLMVLQQAYRLIRVAPYLGMVKLFPLLMVLAVFALSVAVLCMLGVAARRRLFTDEYREEVARGGRLASSLGSPFLYAPLFVGLLGVLASVSH